MLVVAGKVFDGMHESLRQHASALVAEAAPTATATVQEPQQESDATA